MDKAPVSYTTFFAIFIGQDSSIWNVFRLIREFLRRGGLGSKIATTFMLAVMIFVTCWPTMVGSMTGYTPANRAMIKDKRGVLFPFSKFVPLAFIVHDGQRGGLPSDQYPVPAYDLSGIESRGMERPMNN
jgi:hypothetical protein